MLEKLKILIVEDDPANMIVSVKSMEKRGVKVMSAMSASEALAVYENVPDLSAVLTDIQLPGTDGVEMMHKMRQKEETTGILIPIFAMTAYVFGEEKEYFKDLGFDDVFIKPVDYDEVLKTVQLYL
ncbi:response regulator [bacterium]|nr:response regulator [bacterium]